jgi:hypothetical protein
MAEASRQNLQKLQAAAQPQVVAPQKPQIITP